MLIEGGVECMAGRSSRCVADVVEVEVACDDKSGLVGAVAVVA